MPARREFAEELGLKLDNLLRAETNGTELLAYVDGAPYTYAEITDDIHAAKLVAPKVKAGVREAVPSAQLGHG